MSQGNLQRLEQRRALYLGLGALLRRVFGCLSGVVLMIAAEFFNITAVQRAIQPAVILVNARCILRLRRQAQEAKQCHWGCKGEDFQWTWCSGHTYPHCAF